MHPIYIWDKICLSIFSSTCLQSALPWLPWLARTGNILNTYCSGRAGHVIFVGAYSHPCSGWEVEPSTTSACQNHSELLHVGCPGFLSVSGCEFPSHLSSCCFPYLEPGVTSGWKMKLETFSLCFLPSLLSYTEQYVEYDPFLVPPDPSNPWLSDDTTFWELEAR